VKKLYKTEQITDEGAEAVKRSGILRLTVNEEKLQRISRPFLEYMKKIGGEIWRYPSDYK
jgi:hypothetical protein